MLCTYRWFWWFLKKIELTFLDFNFTAIKIKHAWEVDGYVFYLYALKKIIPGEMGYKSKVKMDAVVRVFARWASSFKV
ncbi:MAG: hypothetical protein KG029_01740 [Bacteroidetes bacterium]|nr:hypothetical protein [Bacteroidota bacterium]